MASIHKELVIRAAPAAVWAAIRDLGRLPDLAPGAVAKARMDDDMRVTTYAGASEIREWVVAMDDKKRRLAMTATGGIILHLNSGIQVFAHGANRSRVVWICDFLPDIMTDQIGAIIDRTIASARRVLEQEAPPRHRARTRKTVKARAKRKPKSQSKTARPKKAASRKRL